MTGPRHEHAKQIPTLGWYFLQHRPQQSVQSGAISSRAKLSPQMRHTGCTGDQAWYVMVSSFRILRSYPARHSAGGVPCGIEFSRRATTSAPAERCRKSTRDAEKIFQRPAPISERYFKELSLPLNAPTSSRIRLEGGRQTPCHAIPFTFLRSRPGE